MPTPDNGTHPLDEHQQIPPSAAGGDTAPVPSADEARITAIDGELAILDRYIAEAETGRQRRDFTAKREALAQEKSLLQIKPVLEAPEQESQEQQPVPEPHDFAREGGYSLEVPSYVPQSAVTEETGQLLEECPRPRASGGARRRAAAIGELHRCQPRAPRGAPLRLQPQ